MRLVTGFESFLIHPFVKNDGNTNAHWMVSYKGIVGHYVHDNHVRVIVLGEIQITICVYPKLISNMVELTKKHAQWLEYNGII